MSKSPSPQKGSPWMPVTAGTLTIVAGAAELFVGLVFIAAGARFAERLGRTGLGAIGLPFVVLGIVAVVGGVFAAVRKAWGMAVVGAVAGVVAPMVSVFWFGFEAVHRHGGFLAMMLILTLATIAAVILLVVGRRDFK